MENVELKLGEITVLINMDKNIVNIEVLDKAGTSAGKNEYTLENMVDSETTKDDETVTLENDPIVDDEIPTPAVQEGYKFPSFKEFLNK